MDRREAIHRIAALMGGTLSAPLVAGVLNGCQPGPSTEPWTPATLSAEQSELVAQLSEMIIPETDTPGARAAQVNRFIDLLLTDWYPAEERQHFMTGLDEVNGRARRRFGASFLDCSEEEQVHIMTALADEAISAEAERKPFFGMVKEMTVIGYYTSEIGQNQELNYRIVPGRYDGCVPLEDVYPHLDEAPPAQA